MKRFLFLMLPLALAACGGDEQPPAPAPTNEITPVDNAGNTVEGGGNPCADTRMGLLASKKDC